jgi:hypothetical protein
MKFAYGITTVPERRFRELPNTIQSLSVAGFDEPILFIDGIAHDSTNLDYDQLGLQLIFRGSRVGGYANWVLGLVELYLRNPTADRFVMFEDDLLACIHLHRYLEGCAYKEMAYYNLLTHNQYIQIIQAVPEGWFPSGQRGLGAVGLMFDNQTASQLLAYDLLLKNCTTCNRPRSIDGAICNALSRVGIKEYVHWPSLLQHTGIESTQGHNYGTVGSFNPEFDPLTFLPGNDYSKTGDKPGEPARVS